MSHNPEGISMDMHGNLSYDDELHYCFLGALCPGHWSPDQDCEEELPATDVIGSPTPTTDDAIGALTEQS